jgi:hypothetical protein
MFTVIAKQLRAHSNDAKSNIPTACRFVDTLMALVNITDAAIDSAGLSRT